MFDHACSILPSAPRIRMVVLLPVPKSEMNIAPISEAESAIRTWATDTTLLGAPHEQRFHSQGDVLMFSHSAFGRQRMWKAAKRRCRASPDDDTYSCVFMARSPRGKTRWQWFMSLTCESLASAWNYDKHCRSLISLPIGSRPSARGGCEDDDTSSDAANMYSAPGGAMTLPGCARLGGSIAMLLNEEYPHNGGWASPM